MVDSALYRPIPQAPVTVLPVIPPEIDGPENEQEHHAPAPISPTKEFRIKWIHFVLGCAVLLPWNVLITATPYFLSRLNGSPFRSTFSSYLSTSFTAFNFFSLAYATYTSKRVSQFYRVRSSAVVLTILTLLLTLNTFFHIPPGFFFAFTLLNGIMQAIAGGYLQTSVMTIGALFGPSVMQAVMSGEAAVAVIVSGVQVISATLSLWGQSPSQYNPDTVGDGKAEEDASFMFFVLSTLFLVFVIGAHTYLASMPEYQTTIRANEQHKSIDDENAEEGERWGLVSGARERPHDKARAQIIRVAKANILANIAVAFTFISTLAVFPAITVLIQPTNPNTHPLMFSAIHFFVFNIGDFAGRYACSYPRLLIWSQRKLLILSFARVVFIPLFMMCNIAGSTNPIISSDWLFMFILLACGMSCGYVSTVCIMSASSLEHNPYLKGRREDVDVAATVGSFFLVGGLAVGSVMSFAVRFAFCGCNPFVD